VDRRAIRIGACGPMGGGRPGTRSRCPVLWARWSRAWRRRPRGERGRRDPSILSSGVTVVTHARCPPARQDRVGREVRGRAFHRAGLDQLRTDAGESWVEGTGRTEQPRRSFRGVDVEATLGGTLLIISNAAQRGSSAKWGTIYRAPKGNRSFALGERRGGCVRSRERRRGFDTSARRSDRAMDGSCAGFPRSRGVRRSARVTPLERIELRRSNL